MSTRKEDLGERPVFFARRLRPDVIDVISRAPQSWIEGSLGQIQGRIPEVGSPAEFKRASEDRWKSVSRFDARDSKLAIVVPIHNEERSLRSFLEVLSTLNLPDSVRGEIMLVTNNCQDNSVALVQEFLNRIGSPVVEELPKLERDRQLDPIALSVRKGNLRFTHINTDKAGKANALSVANDLAVRQGFDVLINSDANTYPEPDAIASLYGEARRNFEAEKAVLVWGLQSPSVRSSLDLSLGKFMGITPDSLRPAVKKTRPNGWLFAMDTAWIKGLKQFNGGVPPSAIEDFALSIAARVTGGDLDIDYNAITHGFNPNKLSDDLVAVARYWRGVRQISSWGRDYARLIDQDNPDLADSLRVRFYRARQRVQKGKRLAKIEFGRFLFYEAAILKGKLDHFMNPTNQSWDEIKSTK